MERLSIDEVIEHCNKTCDMAEKNAKARGHELQSIESKQFWEHYQVREWLKELKKYKDAEEQGLLMKLPCKVGDTLYIPYSRPRYIKEVIVTDFMFDGCDLYILTDFVTLGNRDIGKTVFLTKEAAEQALAEMKGV